MLTQPLNSQPAPAPPTTEAELRSDLMSTSPEYDTIELPANTTIVITQPLEITHSVQIIGNNATLLFDQGSTAPWPATASGAIYVDTPFYDNIQLDLDDFTIEFNMSTPIALEQSPRGRRLRSTTRKNNPAGIQHAVIDTGDSNPNTNITIYTFDNLTIDGPPAFDGGSYARLQSQLAARWRDGISVCGRARHGSDPVQRERQRNDLRIRLCRGADRALRRSVEHHEQHGARVHGRHVFARCVCPALAARRRCRWQPGFAVRSRRP